MAAVRLCHSWGPPSDYQLIYLYPRRVLIVREIPLRGDCLSAPPCFRQPAVMTLHTEAQETGSSMRCREKRTNPRSFQSLRNNDDGRDNDLSSSLHLSRKKICTRLCLSIKELDDFDRVYNRNAPSCIKFESREKAVFCVPPFD